MVSGQCMKCKTQREIKNPHEVKTKNGRHAIEGVCPVCNTKIFKFVSKDGKSSSGKRKSSGGRRSSGRRRASSGKRK